MSYSAYSVTRREVLPQPALLARRRVKRSEIAHTIAEVLPRVFLYAQQNGIALAGPPFARYLEASPGMVTIEPGIPIALAIAGVERAGDTDIVLETLPGGPVATTVHAGPYENLHDAYAAIEQWMEAEGLASAGAPWESYVTDPADFADPKDWKTEVFWPLVA
jgi:AraC family transcriptional regulator